MKTNTAKLGAHCLTSCATADRYFDTKENVFNTEWIKKTVTMPIQNVIICYAAIIINGVVEIKYNVCL